MFTFGFCDDKETQENTNKDAVQWLESKEITPTKVNNTYNIQTFTCNETTIKHLDINSVICSLKENGCESVLNAENQQSDLIPATYEGGLKIWECTKDLMEYFITRSIDFKAKRVLDLGCGVGLLGIYSLQKGATVHFQDYNAEVLSHITIPSVQLNINEDDFSNTKYFSGDWASFLNLTIDDHKYDVIVTSETIYNSINHKKLHDIFKNRLRDSGTVYLGAKTYYFGVGGGIRQFEDLIRTENTFDSTVCWKCCEGVKREILQLTFKQ